MAANVAITPGTLNAITGVLAGHSMSAMHQPTSMSLDQQNQQLVDAAQQHQHQQQHQHGQYNPHDAYPHDSASHAISNAASALYLLSQQQNLQRHQNQSQGQVNPSAVSGIPQHQSQPDSPTLMANPSSGASTRRATKRKSVETPAPAPRGKKAKPTNAVSTRGATRRKSSKMEDFDEDMEDFDEEDEDDDMYMDGSMMPPGAGAGSRSNSAAAKSGGSSRKPETEEEKRKNFLERNRQGVYGCGKPSGNNY
jgi:ATF/CREB family transcription factor